MTPLEIESRSALTPMEVGALLGISKYLVIRLIQDGVLPCKRVHKRYLVPMDALRAWLK